MASTNVTITIDDYTISATLDHETSEVVLCDDEGHTLGTGRWEDGSIADCWCDLGDDVYEALDTAMRGALDE